MIKGLADATKIAIAIVLAALIVALAIYLRPTPHRFQFKMAAGQIQRFDTLTGETMFCPEDSPCFGYDRNGVPVSYPEQGNRSEPSNANAAWPGTPEASDANVAWPGTEITENNVSGARR